jgi:hypothetical protein
MISSAAAVAVLLLLRAQSGEQLVESYRKAAEQASRGAFAEAIKVCEELVKAKADKEGVLRVRVGAGLEDREFEPRRLAGDCSAQLARATADGDERLKWLGEAVRWYQASSELGLSKAGPLLEKSRAELARVRKDVEAARLDDAERGRLTALKASVSKRIAERSFRPALAEIDQARAALPAQAKALDLLKDDVESSFLRWQEGMLEDLRRDLASFAPDRVRSDAAKTIERFLRYLVPPERLLASKVDPALLWAEKLLKVLETPGGEDDVADEALRHGFAFFRAAEGLLLERLAAAVKDPGGELDARWSAVSKAEGAFAAAAKRARERVAQAKADDFVRWQREELAALETRVALVRRSLPERDAPRAVDACLARLDGASILTDARPDGYAAVVEELEGLLPRAGADPQLSARIKAGQAVARAHELFLRGSSREDVLQQCRERLQAALAADPAALKPWKERVSPRVSWVLDQIR